MRTSHSVLQWTLAAFVVFAIGAPAVAHEGHHHNAMGTVRAVGSTELQLETKDGKLETFVLTEATTYKRGDAAAKRDAVKVGERAVVMYETKDGKNVAIEVKVGKSEHDGHEERGSQVGEMSSHRPEASRPYPSSHGHSR